MSFELGEFSFSYRSLAVHGFGLSASSNFAVLYQAMQLYLKQGPPVRLDEVARQALEFERLTSHGLAVAADDVYPIVHGGVLKVHTVPVPPGTPDPGVTVEVVPHDPVWIAEHVVVAFNRQGKRHNVPDLLKHLSDHPEAKSFVDRISEQALRAATAISAGDAQKLADSMIAYRTLFDDWTDHSYVNAAVAKLADKLEGLGKQNVLAWKPPGAGASEAIMVITPDRAARDAVVAFFKQNWEDWWCTPAYVSTGLSGEFIKTDGKVRVTAGHRIDFVGAADLGQAEKISQPGICCSCAIEPRSEIQLSGSSLAK